jgi:tetratricopeptide (TPR) repeat protein
MLCEIEDFPGAWEKFNAVIEAKGEKADSLDYTNRAVAYTEIKDFEKAIEDCKKALKLDPKFMDAYHHYSKLMAYKGKLGGAMDILK